MRRHPSALPLSAASPPLGSLSAASPTRPQPASPASPASPISPGPDAAPALSTSHAAAAATAGGGRGEGTSLTAKLLRPGRERAGGKAGRGKRPSSLSPDRAGTAEAPSPEQACDKEDKEERRIQALIAAEVAALEEGERRQQHEERERGRVEAVRARLRAAEEARIKALEIADSRALSQAAEEARRRAQLAALKADKEERERERERERAQREERAREGAELRRVAEEQGRQGLAGQQAHAAALKVDPPPFLLPFLPLSLHTAARALTHTLRAHSHLPSSFYLPTHSPTLTNTPHPSIRPPRRQPSERRHRRRRQRPAPSNRPRPARRGSRRCVRALLLLLARVLFLVSCAYGWCSFLLLVLWLH